MDKIKEALRKISEANGNCMVSLTYEGDYPGNWSIIVGTKAYVFSNSDMLDVANQFANNNEVADVYFFRRVRQPSPR